MRVTLPSTPPSTPEPTAAWLEFRYIEVTRVTPEAHVEFPGPILNADLYGRSWKLVCVPADQFESSSSPWLNSEPEINVAGQTVDGGSYEVVLHTSYLQWLPFLALDLALELNLDYDPTVPTWKDIRAYGDWEATKRAHTIFLRKAVHEIRSGRCRGYEECCRDLARSHGLATQLERAILIHDILESDPPVRKYFTQCLVFIGLNLLGNYNSRDALELLAKDQTDLLQLFQKCHADPFKALPGFKTPVETLPGAELQKISLIRGLLELSGGMMDWRPHTLDQDYKMSDNFNLYGGLVGVTGANWFGNFDPKQMHDALSKSKIFEDLDIRKLNTIEWSMTMMEFLPIGFPEGHLDLPSQVLRGLGSGEVDLVRIYIEHIYSRCPSLQKPKNNILLLLTWSSIVHGRPLHVLSKWASSGDTLELSQRLMGDLQNAQGPEQLALTLAALLCHERLLPYTSNDTTQPIEGYYLADLHALFNGKSLSNQRTVFERMGFSFLRVLATLGDEYTDMIQLLADAVDKDAPLLDLFDGFTDRYMAGRIKNRLSHDSAFKEVVLRLMETTPKLGIDDGSSPQSFDDISEDY